MSTPSPLASARRSTELGLVVMAGAITAAAYTVASLGKNAEIPPIILPFLGATLGLLVVASVATRLFARGADATLLPLAALLHGIGYVMIDGTAEPIRVRAFHVTDRDITLLARTFRAPRSGEQGNR